MKALEPWLQTLPPLAHYPVSKWHITALAGLSNQSFRLQQGDQDLLLRLPHQGGFVDRETEAHNLALAATLGLCPPPLYQQDGVMISRFIRQARPLSRADLQDTQILHRAMAYLQRLHHSGLRFRGEVSISTTLENYSQRAKDAPAEALQLLEDCTPLIHALAIPTAWTPCHLDPHPGNFLLTQSGTLYLLDWEYSAQGDPCWDLATLTGDAAVSGEQLRTLRHSYGSGVVSRVWLYRGLLDLLAALWWYVYHPEAPHAPYPCKRLQRLRGLLADPALDTHLSACG